MPHLMTDDSPMGRLRDRMDSLAEERKETPVERAIKEQSKMLVASVMMMSQEVSQALRSRVEVETESGEEYEFTVEAHRPGEQYKVHCKRIK